MKKNIMKKISLALDIVVIVTSVASIVLAGLVLGGVIYLNKSIDASIESLFFSIFVLLLGVYFLLNDIVEFKDKEE